MSEREQERVGSEWERLGRGEEVRVLRGVKGIGQVAQ